MQRLIEQNINTRQEYERIYDLRNKKEPDQFDVKRWEKLLKFYKGGRLLDLGCLDSLAPLFAYQKYPEAEIWGLDRAKKAVEDMQKKYPFILYEYGDVYHTQLPDKYFDYIVAGELLEHLEHPETCIKEAFRILKDGGVFAISTPLNEAIEPGAVDSDRHIWSYAAQDFRNLTKEYGEVIEQEILGSQKNPYIYHFPNILTWIKKCKQPKTS